MIVWELGQLADERGEPEAPCRFPARRRGERRDGH